MAININVQVARSVARTNQNGLTLAVLKTARKAAGVTDAVVEVNTLQELYDSFEVNDGSATLEAQSAKELYVLEYLIRAGVNLLVYETGTVDVIDADDITAISDLEVLNYKLLTVPYLFIDDQPSADDLRVMTFAKNNDVQLLLDIDPNVATSEAADVVDALENATVVSPKLELYVNAGLPEFTSNYAEFLEDDFDDVAEFYGIPASAAAIARKARLLDAETPWIPVAGETYGRVNEFTKLYRRLTTAEKEGMQAENLNVLFTKVGFGNLFVSQNTMLIDTANPANPLIRSHVVTEALYIKRLLYRAAEQLLYAPNNIKTWNQFSLKARSLFNRMLDQDGIEDFSVQVGRGITMTEQDISEGKFKAVVTFLPIRVIEDITFNIVVQETENAYVIEFEGGDL